MKFLENLELKTITTKLYDWWEITLKRFSQKESWMICPRPLYVMRDRLHQSVVYGKYEENALKDRIGSQRLLEPLSYRNVLLSFKEDDDEDDLRDSNETEEEFLQPKERLSPRLNSFCICYTKPYIV